MNGLKNWWHSLNEAQRKEWSAWSSVAVFLVLFSFLIWFIGIVVIPPPPRPDYSIKYPTVSASQQALTPTPSP